MVGTAWRRSCRRCRLAAAAAVGYRRNPGLVGSLRQSQAPAVRRAEPGRWQLPCALRCAAQPLALSRGRLPGAGLPG
eukprot:12505982-Alexandrium_andersonii.AAC.1